jgi:hypothetical protein
MDQTEEEHLTSKDAPIDWSVPKKSAYVAPPSGPSWLERVFGIKTLTGRLGCYGSVLFVVITPVVGVSYCSSQMAENARIAAEQQAKEDAVKKSADEASYKESVRTGAVCEDGPKGLNTAFQLNVLRQLKDPESFEHMGTVITPSKKGGYDALMRFRSRNSFGGYVVGTAIGTLYVAEHGVCEVRSFQIR